MNQPFNSFKLKKYSFLISLLTTLFFSTNSTAQLVANFTANPTSGCAPLLVSFDSNSSTGNPNSWLWDFGDGSSSSNLQFPQHNYSSPGQYSVTLTIGNGTTTNTIIKSNYITVEGSPVFDFSQSDSGCVGATFNFLVLTSSPSIQSYIWDFGDGTGYLVSTIPNTSHQFNTVGVFNVNLTLTTTTGCASTVTKNNFILTGTRPISNFSATPFMVCFGENVQFTSLTPPPVTGWEWQFGDGASSISQNPSHEYDRDTSTIADPFDITLTSYYNGCPDDTTIADLILVNSPIPNFSYSTDSLNPYTISFTNESGGADSYIWNFGDTSSISNDLNPVHIYSSLGTYTVTLIASNAATGCTNDTSITVTIPNPTAINTIKTSNVILYPNPIINNLSVKMNILNTTLYLKVRDIVGREMMSFNFCVNSDECQFDLSLLPRGLYFIQVIQEAEVIYNHVVIKQ